MNISKALAIVGIWIATAVICCFAIVNGQAGVCWITVLSVMATGTVVNS